MIILILLILISIGAGYFMFGFALIRDFKFKMHFEFDKESPFYKCYFGDQKKIDEFEKKKEIIEIISDDGLKLKAFFLKNKTHKYMILCHGYTGSHREHRRYAIDHYKNGFNCLLPDARSHNESDGKYIGMGYLERYDVLKWINYLISIDPKAKIVLFGHSMGGATVLNTATLDLPVNVKCVIEDCAYGSAYDEFKMQLKNLFHLPAFPILDIANLFCILLAKYNLKDTSLYERLSKTEIPILFIHGEDDDFVSFDFLGKLYDSKTGIKEVYTVKNAKHCEAFPLNEKKYYDVMYRFMDKYL